RAWSKRNFASLWSSWAMIWPSFTKAPTLTGVEATRPAAGGATSDVSSATKLPLDWIKPGTWRDTTGAEVTWTGSASRTSAVPSFFAEDPDFPQDTHQARLIRIGMNTRFIKGIFLRTYSQRFCSRRFSHLWTKAVQ